MPRVPYFRAQTVGYDLARLQEILRLRPVTKGNAKWEDVAFVCIDCEVWEHDQTKLTEVGISVLDTRSLPGTSQPVEQDICHGQIVDAHLIIDEHKKLVNKDFVKGHPNKFAFGASQTINLQDVPGFLAKVFHDPSDLPKIIDDASESKGTARNVILVGHAISNDVQFLKAAHFHFEKIGNIVGIVDTQLIFSKKAQPSLARLIDVLNLQSGKDIKGLKFLHNAGNDAHWTMKVMIAMIFKEYQESGSVLPAILALKNASRFTKANATSGEPQLQASEQKQNQGNSSKRAFKAKQTHEHLQTRPTNLQRGDKVPQAPPLTPRTPEVKILGNIVPKVTGEGTASTSENDSGLFPVKRVRRIRSDNPIPPVPIKKIPSGNENLIKKYRVADPSLILEDRTGLDASREVLSEERDTPTSPP